MTEQSKREIVPEIKNCARCCGAHENLTFFELENPIVDARGKELFTHWTMCPTNNEPLVMRVLKP